MSIAVKVATRVLAEDYFVVDNPLSELKDEVLMVSKLPGYEKKLQEAREEYEAAKKAHAKNMTPGKSNPKARYTAKQALAHPFFKREEVCNFLLHKLYHIYPY